MIVQQDRSDRVASVPTALSPWLEPLSRAGLVVLLVPFMLLAREGLRNRLIRLLGFHRLAVTTRAMDEAGARVRLRQARRPIEERAGAGQDPWTY